MAEDMFMKIDGIDGESTDDKHADWFAIQSFGWGVTRDAAMGGSGDPGTAAEFQPIHITKSVDKGSPDIMLAVAKGKEFEKIEFHFTGATGEKHVFMKYEMEQCVFISYNAGGSSGGGERPLEDVGISYGKIKVECTPVKDGQAGAAVDRTWDLVTNSQG